MKTFKLPAFLYWVLLFLFTIMALGPFVLLWPKENLPIQVTILLIFFSVVAIFYKGSPELRRRQFFTVFLVMIFFHVLAFFIIRYLPLSAQTDYLAKKLGLDGEGAYDAAMYEAWCETWLFLVIIHFTGRAFRKWMPKKFKN